MRETRRHTCIEGSARLKQPPESAVVCEIARARRVLDYKVMIVNLRERHSTIRACVDDIGGEIQDSHSARRSQEERGVGVREEDLWRPR